MDNNNKNKLVKDLIKNKEKIFTNLEKAMDSYKTQIVIFKKFFPPLAITMECHMNLTDLMMKQLKEDIAAVEHKDKKP